MNNSSTLIVSLDGRFETYNVLASLSDLSVTAVAVDVFLSKGETYLAKKTGLPDSSAERRLNVSKTDSAVSVESNSIVACPLKAVPDEFMCIRIEITHLMVFCISISGNSDIKLVK